MLYNHSSRLIISEKVYPHSMMQCLSQILVHIAAAAACCHSRIFYYTAPEQEDCALGLMTMS